MAKTQILMLKFQEVILYLCFSSVIILVVVLVILLVIPCLLVLVPLKTEKSLPHLEEGQIEDPEDEGTCLGVSPGDGSHYQGCHQPN